MLSFILKNNIEIVLYLSMFVAKQESKYQKTFSESHERSRKLLLEQPWAVLANAMVLLCIVLFCLWLVKFSWRKLLANRKFASAIWSGLDCLMLLTMYFLVMIVAQQLAMPMTADPEMQGFIAYWLANISFVVVFAIFVLQVCKGSKKILGLRAISWREPTAASLGYVLFFPVYLASVFFTQMLFAGLNIPPKVQEVSNNIIAASGIKWWLGVSTAVIVAPLAEEFIFRVFLYTSLRKILSVYPAVIISSLLFSLVHVNAFAFIPIFILGMFLALLYEKTQSWWAPVIAHTIHNSITLVYLFLFAK